MGRKWEEPGTAAHGSHGETGCGTPSPWGLPAPSQLGGQEFCPELHLGWGWPCECLLCLRSVLKEGRGSVLAGRRAGSKVPSSKPGCTHSAGPNGRCGLESMPPAALSSPGAPGPPGQSPDELSQAAASPRRASVLRCVWEGLLSAPEPAGAHGREPGGSAHDPLPQPAPPPQPHSTHAFQRFQGTDLLSLGKRRSAENK